MIYDCFLFNNEFDILRLRLSELYDIVDRFVLMEFNVSMRGKAKPYHFDEHKDEFRKWLPKIYHLKGPGRPFREGASHNEEWEYFQRDWLNAKMNHVIHDDDTVIFGDADEIPLPSAVKGYTNGMGSHRFIQHFSYYFFNLRRPDHTTRQIIGPGIQFRKLGFNHMRWDMPCGNSLFNPGGWHFSFLGGVAALKDKISQAGQGIASDWINTEDPSVLESRIKAGKLYDGSQQYSFVPIDESFPESIRNNQQFWKSRGYIGDLLA